MSVLGYGIVGAVLAVGYGVFVTQTEKRTKSMLGVKVEALHTAASLFSMMVALQVYRFRAPDAFDDVVVYLDMYVQLRNGVREMRQRDPKYATTDALRKRAFAIRDQAHEALNEFVRTAANVADPVELVRIEKQCTAVRGEIEAVWRMIVADGRLMFN